MTHYNKIKTMTCIYPYPLFGYEIVSTATQSVFNMHSDAERGNEKKLNLAPMGLVPKPPFQNGFQRLAFGSS